ncbi:MAG: FHA domain-containing protein [Atopobiaceae bacterium]
MFADMNVCYGCLYDFERDQKESSVGLLIPDDWDAGLPPLGYDDEGGTTSASLGLGGCLALRVCDPTLEVVVALGPAGVVVGRGEDCDVVLHATSVSRRHVRVDPSGDVALVRDLGATNPARLDGREISDEARMVVGQTLDVCGTLLTLVRR